MIFDEAARRYVRNLATEWGACRQADATPTLGERHAAIRHPISDWDLPRNLFQLASPERGPRQEEKSYSQ